MIHQDVKRTAHELKAEAEKVNNQFLDPQRRARMAAALADLENKLKEKQGGLNELDIAASKSLPILNCFTYRNILDSLTDEPSNAGKQANFKEKLAFFQSACDGVKKANNNNLAANARKEKQDVNSLARAARAGDAKNVVQFAREAATTQVQVVADARYPHMIP